MTTTLKEASSSDGAPRPGGASADQDGYEELDSQIQKQIEDLTLEEEEEEEEGRIGRRRIKEDDEEDFINREEEREDKLQRTRARTAAYPTPACSRDARRRINGSAIRKLGVAGVVHRVSLGEIEIKYYFFAPGLAFRRTGTSVFVTDSTNVLT